MMTIHTTEAGPLDNNRWYVQVSIDVDGVKHALVTNTVGFPDQTTANDYANKVRTAVIPVEMFTLRAGKAE